MRVLLCVALLAAAVEEGSGLSLRNELANSLDAQLLDANALDSSTLHANALDADSPGDDAQEENELDEDAPLVSDSSNGCPSGYELLGDEQYCYKLCYEYERPDPRRHCWYKDCSYYCDFVKCPDKFDFTKPLGKSEGWCRKDPKLSYTRKRRRLPLRGGCPNGYTQKAAMCYRKCEPDFVPIALECSPRCPRGTADVGVACEIHGPNADHAKDLPSGSKRDRVCRAGYNCTSTP
jgi:hypothetical protein